MSLSLGTFFSKDPTVGPPRAPSSSSTPPKPGTLRRLGVTASSALLLTLLPWTSASAAPTVGVDLHAGAAADDSDADSGGGFGLRAGEEWELLVLTLCPELSGQYGSFGGARDPDVYQLMVGGRLGIGFIIEPSIYAHAGVGYLDQDLYESSAGLAYDAGLALDLTVIPFMDIGLHAHLAGISGDESRGLGWGMAGVHVEFEGN